MLNNFDFSVIPVSLPFIWQGLIYSLELTLTAMVGGVVLGTLLALARLSGGPKVSGAARLYVDLMRSVPLLMVILWFFFLIPLLIGRPIGAEMSAMITFTLFQAAFYSEIMRAGIQSVPKGQAQRRLRHRHDLLAEPWVTSCCHRPSATCYPCCSHRPSSCFRIRHWYTPSAPRDLLKAAEITGMNYNRSIEMYIFVSLIYFAICFSLSMLVKHFNKRIAIIR